MREMVKMFKKVLSVTLATSLLIGTPTFAAVNLTDEGQKTSIIDVFKEAKMITVVGKLELQPIYYCVAPGPNDPLYMLKIVTDSGKEYYLAAPVEEYEMYVGKILSVKGLMRNSTIANFSFEVVE